MFAESPAPRPQRAGKELVVENERSMMDSNDLRELQAPLKEKYREDPGAAVVTLRARGDLADGAIACKVETGRALGASGAASGDRRQRARRLFGRHAARSAGRLRRRHPEGGGDRDRLQAARRCGRAPRAISISAARSASTSAAPVGFGEIRLSFDARHRRARGSAPHACCKLTERYCVVLQTLRVPPKLTASLSTG